MKNLRLKKLAETHQMNFLTTWKIFSLFIFAFLLPGFKAIAQPELPVITVRFNNPQYDCPTQTYCVDVEFISDTPGLQLFGMNVRFFYDDNILEYLSMGDFQEGYGSQEPPEIITGPAGSGAQFGIAGPMEWFNGSVQDTSTTSTTYLSTTEWTKLFNICFHVDDPNSLSIRNFCPTILWDLQVDPEMGGFVPGDDGVVMTVADLSGQQDSSPTTENVVQFNWQYDITGNLIGYPVSIICISTICGYIIPLSNWSLVLAIGLMLAASVFIYRRRISG
jgi:hypothetical protein